MNLSTVNRLLDKIEAPQAAAEAQAGVMLATWRDLLRWFVWTRQFSDWRPAYNALAIDHDIKQLAQRLTWCWRHFAGATPEEYRNRFELGKWTMEWFITRALSDGVSPDELATKEGMDFCLQLVNEIIADDEMWQKFNEPIRDNVKNDTNVANATFDKCFTNNQEDNTPEAAPEPEPDRVEREAPPPPAEVTNGNIRVKFLGSIGISIRNADGKTVMPSRGDVITITPETWRNIQEFSRNKWERIL